MVAQKKRAQDDGPGELQFFYIKIIITMQISTNISPNCVSCANLYRYHLNNMYPLKQKMIYVLSV
jgi:hypothetical protein